MLQLISRNIPAASTNSINQVKDEWILEGGHRFSQAILILTSVNVIAAFLTIASIFYEAWSTKEWDFYPKTRRIFSFIPIVHPAHVFPIIFLTAVIIQGAVLIGISVGESHSFLHGCRATAQVVWPVLWIAPYITLMFGLETTLRLLQKTKLGVQGRWHITICVGSALVLTLLTWIPSKLSPSDGLCLSSVIWWTAHYAKAGFAIALALIVAYALCAVVIIFQLVRTVKMDRDQRIQASTVVYYMIVTAVILSMIIPYYTQLIMLGDAIRVSKVAEVALNITGIVPAILRVLLRSNANWTMIQAAENYGRKKSQSKARVTDLDIYDHITSPVSVHTWDTQTLLNDREKKAVKSFEPATPAAVVGPQSSQMKQANGLQSPPPSAVPITPPTQIEPMQHENPNRTNYSIFPTHASQMVRQSVSTTFSQGDDDIEPPRPLFACSHKRDYSDQSSATVQIGMRLSNLPHSSGLVESPTGPSMPRFLNSVDSPYGSPQVAERVFLLPESPKSPLNDITILPIHPNMARTPSQSVSPRGDLLSPSWLLRNTSRISSKNQRRQRDTMKSLPPIPPSGAASIPSVQRSPQLSRLTSGRDIPPSEKWV